MSVAGKTSASLANALGSAVHSAVQAVTPGVVAAKTKATLALMEQLEVAARDAVGPIFRKLADVEGAPPELANVFRALAEPKQATQMLFSQIGLWMVLQPLVSKILEPFLQRFTNAAWRANLDMPLSPAESALAVIRGHMTEEQARDFAHQVGISDDKLATLINNTGEPPAIEELLFLHRRGKIDTERLVHGIRQSRVRNEWIDAIEALTFAPMSAGEAVQAHVQGHLDEAASRQKWAENGFEPGDWQPAFETAGEPIAIGQALDLLNRRKMDEATVIQAIRESRVKNKYIDQILQLRVYLPPVRTIVALLRQHAIDRPRALELFAENGVRPEDAQAYADEAENTRSARHKQLTESQIIAFYRDRAIGKDEASRMLLALGLGQFEVDLILLNTDLELANHIRATASSRIRASFVAHKIDETTARAELHGLHLNDEAIQLRLDTWIDERAANVRVPSEAQIVAAAKHNVISASEAGARLMEMGYGADDAAMLLATAGLRPG